MNFRDAVNAYISLIKENDTDNYLDYYGTKRQSSDRKSENYIYDKIKEYEENEYKYSKAMKDNPSLKNDPEFQKKIRDNKTRCEALKKAHPEAFDEKIENGQGRARRMHSEYNDGGSIYSPRLTKKDRTDVRALPNDEERDIVSRADSKRNAVEKHMINKIRKERY